MLIRLTRNLVPNIGLIAGREIETWDELPPRADNLIWVEGDRRFRLNRLLEKVELTRYALLAPDEYEVIEQ